MSINTYFYILSDILLYVILNYDKLQQAGES